jgi:hypothetical protein
LLSASSSVLEGGQPDQRQVGQDHL